jgi:glycosyltransferase involved in cell wall biosynthesis
MTGQLPPQSSQDHPLVSVIMNCYNSDQYLKEAVDCVFAQTYSNWEIIFWDNASTDNSAKIAKSYTDERMRYFQGELTVPLGMARNLAIEKSSGKFIAFLDCDDLWMPEKLALQVDLFKNEKIGLVYSDVVNFMYGKTLSRLFEHASPIKGNVFSELLQHYILPMSSVVVRKEILSEIGGLFDNRFHVLEDKDFFLRIAKISELDFVPQVLSKWRVRADSESHQQFDRFSTENALLLRKFKELWPGFENDYSSEIQKVTEKMSFQEAVECWKQGEYKQARVLLKGKFYKRKFKLFYIVTFLPSVMFSLVFKLYFFVRRFVGV